MDDGTKNPYGDKALEIISNIINSRIRYDIDLAFCYSKDRFTIILPEVNRPQADNVACSIQKMIQNGKMENITINVGIFQCDYQKDAEEFIKSAGVALLKGKQNSKRK